MHPGRGRAASQRQLPAAPASLAPPRFAAPATLPSGLLLPSRGRHLRLGPSDAARAGQPLASGVFLGRKKPPETPEKPNTLGSGVPFPAAPGTCTSWEPPVPGGALRSAAGAAARGGAVTAPGERRETTPQPAASEAGLPAGPRRPRGHRQRACPETPLPASRGARFIPPPRLGGEAQAPGPQGTKRGSPSSGLRQHCAARGRDGVRAVCVHPAWQPPTLRGGPPWLRAPSPCSAPRHSRGARTSPPSNAPRWHGQRRSGGAFRVTACLCRDTARA